MAGGMVTPFQIIGLKDGGLLYSQPHRWRVEMKIALYILVVVGLVLLWGWFTTPPLGNSNIPDEVG